MALMIGIYAGIYIDQNYDVPKVYEPKEIWNRLEEFMNQHKKDK